MTEMKEILFNKKDQLTVYSDGIHYELEWMSWGHNIRKFRKGIEQSDFEAYRNGEHSGDDLIFKAQNGVWPPTKAERHQSELEFLKSELQLVHDVSLPNNPKLFEEFPELKSVYEQWLSEHGGNESNS